MPAILKLPLDKRFKLDLPTDEDPSQDSEVGVRQATQAEVEARAELTADASRVFRQGSQEIEVKQRWSVEEQKRKEVYLTLSYCNLTREDDNGASLPLFRFQKVNGKMVLAMSEDEFAAAWGLLPENWAEAIHDKVLLVNPLWNPNS